jgi:pyruvate/2-oxoglutarate/acetoin dehydrogenase E1 component
MSATESRTFCDELYHALRDEMERDPKLILLGEDIREYGGAFAVTRDLHKRFPGRVLNAPISENSFVGVATGAALGGLRVVVEIMFMDFVTLAMDQIVNHAAKVHYMYAGQFSVPIVMRMPFGGYRGYGPSHSQTLTSWFLSVPGLKVVVPSCPSHAGSLLKAAIRDGNPVLFLEHKLLYGRKVAEGLHGAPGKELLRIGQARVARQGSDVSIVTYGFGVHLALQAAQQLSAEGLGAEVVDLVTLKPYDAETIFASVRKTGKAVFLEEGVKTGGVGAEICAAVAENCLWDLDGRLVRVGAKDLPVPAAVEAEALVLPGVADVVRAAREAVGS